MLSLVSEARVNQHLEAHTQQVWIADHDPLQGIGAIAQYTAFTTPVALKLFFNKGRFRPGPWQLGKFSKPLNIVACIWLAPLSTSGFRTNDVLQVACDHACALLPCRERQRFECLDNELLVTS